MRKHRPSDDIADRVNSGHCGLTDVVDFNKASFVLRNTTAISEQAFSEWFTTNRHNQFIKGVFLRAVLRFEGNRDLLTFDIRPLDQGAGQDIQSLLRENFARFFRDLLISNCKEVIQRFEDCHFRAETVPN